MAASKPRHRVQAIKQNRTLKQLSLAETTIPEEGAFALLEAGSYYIVLAASSQPPQNCFSETLNPSFPASLEHRPAGAPNKRGGAAARSDGLRLGRLGRFGQGPRGTGQGPPDRPGG